MLRRRRRSTDCANRQIRSRSVNARIEVHQRAPVHGLLRSLLCRISWNVPRFVRRWPRRNPKATHSAVRHYPHAVPQGTGLERLEHVGCPPCRVTNGQSLQIRHENREDKHMESNNKQAMKLAISCSHTNCWKQPASAGYFRHASAIICLNTRIHLILRLTFLHLQT